MKSRQNILAVGLVFLLSLLSLIIACETGDNCPTTKSCGCSPYNKADCNNHTSWCEWDGGSRVWM